ncbi:uncharacterized protein ATNIH1004_009564 [Aspergillus tanneri]|nr:uncharacterized protein ATNIH1004_009564 [Aspergillus tanneri]KAA8642812.1 hypothetical protein ATNIH1004_009564 [Aspergillus tanneri]
MAWGGEPIGNMKHVEDDVSRSKEEICSLWGLYQNPRPYNILWNGELKRALIIDFHCSELDPRPVEKRPVKKRPSYRRSLTVGQRLRGRNDFMRSTNDDNGEHRD